MVRLDKSEFYLKDYVVPKMVRLRWHRWDFAVHKSSVGNYTIYTFGWSIDVDYLWIVVHVDSFGGTGTESDILYPSFLYPRSSLVYHLLVPRHNMNSVHWHIQNVDGVNVFFLSYQQYE